MSKTSAKSLFLVVTGMLVGGLAFQALQSEATTSPEPKSAAASAPVAPPVESQEPEIAEPEPEPAAPFTVAAESAKAFGHPALYGRFHVEAGPDVKARDVRLLVESVSGNRIEDVFGAEWKRRGENAEVLLGDLSAGSSTQVVVEFADASESRIDLRVAFQDIGKETPTHVNVNAPSATLTAAFHSADTETLVHRELSQRAMTRAEKLADERKFDEALQTIDDARGWIASAGMALRISGDLERSTNELKELRADVKERSKPKPVVRKQQRKIEIVRGDRT